MATIIGKNNQKEEKSSFLLQIRYSAADSKMALQKYVSENPMLAKTPMTKKLVKEIFFNGILYRFSCISRKGVEPLAEFLFDKAFRNNYIVAVPKIWSTDEQEYIVSPLLGENKPGPKSKRKE